MALVLGGVSWGSDWWDGVWMAPVFLSWPSPDWGQGSKEHVELKHDFPYFVRQKVLVAAQPLPNMSLQVLGREEPGMRKGKHALWEDPVSLPSRWVSCAVEFIEGEGNKCSGGRRVGNMAWP